VIAGSELRTGYNRKYKGRPLGRPSIQFFPAKSGLDTLHVLGLPALGAFDHIELNLLAFLEAAESTRLYGGEVYEYILTILAANETITLGVVEPLYCSCFHGVALFPLLVDVALKLAGLVQAGHAGRRRNCRVHRTAKIKRSTILRDIPEKYPQVL
jgi:hypothetical protein